MVIPSPKAGNMMLRATELEDLSNPLAHFGTVNGSNWIHALAIRDGKGKSIVDIL